MEDPGDVGLWGVRFQLGLSLHVGFGVSAAEEAVGYGDADQEEVEEFPAPGEDGFVTQLRGLGWEDGEKGDEHASEDSLVDEIGQRCR